MPEVSFTQVSSAEIGSAQIGLVEEGPAYICSRQVCASQVRQNEKGVLEIGLGHISTVQIGLVRSICSRLASLKSGMVVRCALLHRFQASVPCLSISRCCWFAIWITSLWTRVAEINHLILSSPFEMDT